jgi:putative hydrolase of the HAD superfamily
MLKAVLFDVGGVLIRLDESKYYKYLSKISGIEVNKIINTLHILENKIDLGEISIKEFTEAVSKRLGIMKKEVKWLGFLKENISINKEVVDFAFQLHKRYKIGIITNADRARYLYVKKHFGKELKLDKFDHVFVSCYLGMAKPSKRLFEYAINKMGVMPSEAVFIDDHIENVEGARAIGINGILFKKPNDNVEYLKKQIVKIEDSLI